MVGFAGGVGCGAVREDAAAVAECECFADGRGDEALGVADIEDFGWASEDHWHEVGVAAQPAEVSGGDVGTFGQPPGLPGALPQVPFPDGDRDAGPVAGAISARTWGVNPVNALGVFLAARVRNACSARTFCSADSPGGSCAIPLLIA